MSSMAKSQVQKFSVKMEENCDSKEQWCRKGWPIMQAGFATLGYIVTKSFYILHNSIIQIIIIKSIIFSTSFYGKGYKVATEFQHEREDESFVDKNEEDNAVVFEDLSCKHKILPPLDSLNKKTIFLDMDETLIHSMADPPTQRFDFIVKPNVNGVVMNFYVVKRPGVDELLESLAAKFEIVVFTAGMKEYASLILDKLDRKGLISHRLYRDSCKFVEGRFVKDLSEMGRDLKNVVIVDDNPYSYMLQPWNGIPIRAFIDDRNDKELNILSKFLDKCDSFHDMRDVVRCYRKVQKKNF